MSAIYGVRFTCDHCAAVAATWQENGQQPSIHRDPPPGWKQCGWASITTGAPLHQRPHVCPACVPVLDAWEAEMRAWYVADQTEARAHYDPANAAVAAFRLAHPKPGPPPLAALRAGVAGGGA